MRSTLEVSNLRKRVRSGENLHHLRCLGAPRDIDLGTLRDLGSTT